MNHEQHGFASDLWSAGLTLIECIIGMHPFGENYVFLKHEMKPKCALILPDSIQVSDAFRSFFSTACSNVPEERTSAKQLLQHEFVVTNVASKPSLREWLHHNYILVLKQKSKAQQQQA